MLLSQGLLGRVVLFMAFFVASAAFWPLAAVANECVGLPSSNLSVVVFHRVTRTAIVDREVLDQIAGEVRSSRPKRQAHPLMLITSEPAADIAVDRRTVEVGQNTFCAAPHSVRVTIGFPERSVYMVRAAEENPCAQRELSSHDENHARADDAALLKVLAQIEKPLIETLSRLKQSPAATAAAAAEEFEKGLRAFLNDAVVQFAEERDRLQEHVDAPAELERLRSACGGSVMRLEQRAGARGI